MTEREPFFAVGQTTRNWPTVETVIIAASGVVLPREAALALRECFREVLAVNVPKERWAPFLPHPDVIRAEYRDLEACLTELGWAG